MQLEGSRLFFLLFILASCEISLSQENTSLVSDNYNAEQKVDTVATGKQDNHSLYFTSGLSDNLVIASSVSHRQLYYTASLYYAYKDSYYMGASSFHLPGYREAAALNAIYAGYYRDFAPWFDVNLSLYGYLVPEQLETSLFTSFFSTDLKVGVDWNLIYTEISASWIPGEGSSNFYQAKNSRYIQFPVSKNLLISMQPYAEFVFGSMVKIELGGETYTGIRSSTARWSNKSFNEEFTEQNQGGASGSTSPGGNSGNGGSPGSNGNYPGSGNNPEQPQQPAVPTPSEDPFPDQGSHYGTQSGSDSGSQGQSGSDAGSQDGTQSGTESGNGSGSQEGTQTVSGSGSQTGTQSGSGSYSGSGSGSDKTGSGSGSKGVMTSEDPAIVPVPEWSVSDFFGLVEVEVGIPVSISTGRFIFEIEPGYVKSMYNDPYIPANGGLTFMMSVYLKLF